MYSVHVVIIVATISFTSLLVHIPVHTNSEILAGDVPISSMSLHRLSWEVLRQLNSTDFQFKKEEL